MKILITGGAGFIGSAMIRHLLETTSAHIFNIDKLTYAANHDALAAYAHHPNYHFQQLDICASSELSQILNTFQPDKIMHFAAESHVDNSISGPAAFIQTNIVGTFTLLEACRQYWQGLTPTEQHRFRFHHISTDEVYGDLEDTHMQFTETTPYAPSSPYSASKASSDHLVRAWHRTYGLPTLITNCSNNYGPYQHAEKFIPTLIRQALAGKPLPIYGDGRQVRDWLYVEDHARALEMVLNHAQVGETYNIGGLCEKQNIEVVHLICQLLETHAPQKPEGVDEYQSLIQYVKDRPGHDVRYAMDISKMKRDFDWTPKETFESGLEKTVTWYLHHSIQHHANSNKVTS